MLNNFRICAPSPSKIKWSVPKVDIHYSYRVNKKGTQTLACSHALDIEFIDKTFIKGIWQFKPHLKRYINFLYNYSVSCLVFVINQHSLIKSHLGYQYSHGGLSMATKDTQQLFSAITAVENQLFYIYIGNLVPRAFPFLSLGRREKALAPGGHMTFNTQI